MPGRIPTLCTYDLSHSIHIARTVHCSWSQKLSSDCESQKYPRMGFERFMSHYSFSATVTTTFIDVREERAWTNGL